MTPRKQKPHRVSYYFPTEAVNGKVRLYTRPVMALTADDAATQVQRVFRTAVIRKAYHNYRPYKHAAKPTFIELPLQQNAQQSVPSFPSTVTMTTPGPVSTGVGVAFAKTGTSDKFVPLGQVTSFTITTSKRRDVEEWNGHRFVGLPYASHLTCERCGLSNVYAKADNIFCVNAPKFVPDAQLDPNMATAPKGYVGLDDSSGIVKNEVFPGLETVGYTPQDEPGLQPTQTTSVPEPEVTIGCGRESCFVCGPAIVADRLSKRPVGSTPQGRDVADKAVDEIIAPKMTTEEEINPFEWAAPRPVHTDGDDEHYYDAAERIENASAKISKWPAGVKIAIAALVLGIGLVTILYLKGFHVIP